MLPLQSPDVLKQNVCPICLVVSTNPEMEIGQDLHHHGNLDQGVIPVPRNRWKVTITRKVASLKLNRHWICFSVSELVGPRYTQCKRSWPWMNQNPLMFWFGSRHDMMDFFFNQMERLTLHPSLTVSSITLTISDSIWATCEPLPSVGCVGKNTTDVTSSDP